MRIFFLFLLLCIPPQAGYTQDPAAAPAANRPISLNEAFRLALAKSEALAAQGEGVMQLEAFERQIKAGFQPALNLNASESAAGRQAGQGQSAVNLSYSIFAGMSNYIAAASAGRRTEAARLQLARAGQALYDDVAQDYINLYDITQELAIRREQLGVSDNRIKELQERERIGRSRESEVVAAQSQLAQDEADLQNAMGRESLAQLLLRFLTGLDADLAPAPIRVPDVGPIGPYLAKAGRRFDVEAARKAADAARLDAEIERKLSWPSVNAGANYYLTRSAPNQDSSWDAGLSLKIPLYTGGAVKAGVDQAAARQTAAGFALTLAARQADTEVRTAYSALTHSIAVFESLKKALKLADDNARYQTRDYGLGLVTNLDVLNAQNTLLQTKLNLEQAQARACSAVIQLEVAGGGPAVNAERN
jgi:outer membrane protein